MLKMHSVYAKYALAALVLVAVLLSFVALAAPKVSAGNLYAGNLHMHTDCSDGEDSYDAMVEESVRLGFRFIAITDHNFCPNYIERCRNETRILCIPSMEFTTPNWHMLAIGIAKNPAEEECIGAPGPGPCDGGLSLQETVRRVHAQGGLAIAAHPANGLPNKINAQDLPLFDAMECDHPSYGLAQGLETIMLRNGAPIPCVYDSDAHNAESLGVMYSVCGLDNLTEEGVKAAIVGNKCRQSGLLAGI